MFKPSSLIKHSKERKKKTIIPNYLIIVYGLVESPKFDFLFSPLPFPFMILFLYFFNLWRSIFIIKKNVYHIIYIKWSVKRGLEKANYTNNEHLFFNIYSQN